MVTTGTRLDGSKNQLLSTLRSDCLEWLRPRQATITLVNGQVLHERGEAFEHVFFLDAGMVSIVAESESLAHGIEVGVVGRDGMVGIAALLDDQPVAFHRAMVQMPGSARRMSISTLRDGLATFPEFHRVCMRFVQAYMAQVAVCNSGHVLVERCARWILMSGDRSDSLDVPLTQEFLATMLGVRRSGVTVAAGALQRQGLIRYARGHITIHDRDGLERAACICYRRTADECARLLS